MMITLAEAGAMVKEMPLRWNSFFRGLKKLDKVLERLQGSNETSRENSPEPAKAKQERSGSSRRYVAFSH